MMILNLTRQSTIASDVIIASQPLSRMKGLLGKREFHPGQALIITHCQSIHMFFMKFAIDVVFCDRNNKVVGICEGIKPFFLSPIFFKASFAIELPAGTVRGSGTQIGDLCQWELPIN
ncbi:MAG: DUF192 domain-containing protein [Candidatus Omnitrophica bacterium]|nr:DUF192 domain-containing protein [Candidatus Omnitrophota bacterium]